MENKKSYGVTRRLDNLARVVIPAEFRRELGMEPNEKIEICLVKDGIFLRKPDKSCVFCGAPADREFEDHYICDDCRKKLRAHLGKKVAKNEK